jgi:hypothetical protein
MIIFLDHFKEGAGPLTADFKEGSRPLTAVFNAPASQGDALWGYGPFPKGC